MEGRRDVGLRTIRSSPLRLLTGVYWETRGSSRFSTRERRAPARDLQGHRKRAANGSGYRFRPFRQEGGQIGVLARPSRVAAVTGLTRQLAVECGGHVRVNCVLAGQCSLPNGTESERTTACRAPWRLRSGAWEGSRRVPAAVAFLLSRDASFVTGASLAVDGGWSVQEFVLTCRPKEYPCLISHR